MFYEKTDGKMSKENGKIYGLSTKSILFVVNQIILETRDFHKTFIAAMTSHVNIFKLYIDSFKVF